MSLCQRGQGPETQLRARSIRYFADETISSGLCMKIKIVCVGRTKEKFIQQGVEKYLKFIRNYADVEFIEVKDERGFDLKDAPIVRKREAQRIQKAIREGSMIIALDERGEEFTSYEFAAYLNGLAERGVREITFVTGGALGLDECITAAAGKVMALSRWTLTHDMARLVLLEQIYRAFTIITGKTYHY